eukprot:PhF_6_TR23261/c0_g1_i1/m.32694
MTKFVYIILLLFIHSTVCTAECTSTNFQDCVQSTSLTSLPSAQWINSLYSPYIRYGRKISDPNEALPLYSVPLFNGTVRIAYTDVRGKAQVVDVDCTSTPCTTTSLMNYTATSDEVRGLATLQDGRFALLTVRVTTSNGKGMRLNFFDSFGGLVWSHQINGFEDVGDVQSFSSGDGRIVVYERKYFIVYVAIMRIDSNSTTSYSGDLVSIHDVETGMRNHSKNSMCVPSFTQRLSYNADLGVTAYTCSTNCQPKIGYNWGIVSAGGSSGSQSLCDVPPVADNVGPVLGVGELISYKNDFITVVALGKRLLAPEAEAVKVGTDIRVYIISGVPGLVTANFSLVNEDFSVLRTSPHISRYSSKDLLIGWRAYDGVLWDRYNYSHYLIRLELNSGGNWVTVGKPTVISGSFQDRDEWSMTTSGEVTWLSITPNSYNEAVVTVNVVRIPTSSSGGNVTSTSLCGNGLIEPIIFESCDDTTSCCTGCRKVRQCSPPGQCCTLDCRHRVSTTVCSKYPLDVPLGTCEKLAFDPTNKCGNCFNSYCRNLSPNPSTGWCPLAKTKPCTTTVYKGKACTVATKSVDNGAVCRMNNYGSPGVCLDGTCSSPITSTYSYEKRKTLSLSATRQRNTSRTQTRSVLATVDILSSPVVIDPLYLVSSSKLPRPTITLRLLGDKWNSKLAGPIVLNGLSVALSKATVAGFSKSKSSIVSTSTFSVLNDSHLVLKLGYDTKYEVDGEQWITINISSKAFLYQTEPRPILPSMWIKILLLRLPPPEVVQSVTIMSTIAAIGSVTVAPAVAANLQTMALIGGIECMPQQLQKLSSGYSVFSSPLKAIFGDFQNLTASESALVWNSILHGGIAVGHASAAMLFSVVKKSSLVAGFQTLKCPSMSVTAFGMFAQGTTKAAVRTLEDTDSAGFLWLSTLTIVFVPVGLLVASVYVNVIVIPDKLSWEPYDLTKTNKFIAFLVPRGQWVHEDLTKRFGAFFSNSFAVGSRILYFHIVCVVFMVVLGIVASLPTTSADSCEAVKSTCVVIITLFGIFHLVKFPHRSLAENVLIGVTNIIQAVIIILTFMDDSDSLTQALSAVQLLLNVLLLLKTCVGAHNKYWTHKQGKKKPKTSKPVDNDPSSHERKRENSEGNGPQGGSIELVEQPLISKSQTSVVDIDGVSPCPLPPRKKLVLDISHPKEEEDDSVRFVKNPLSENQHKDAITLRMDML